MHLSLRRSDRDGYLCSMVTWFRLQKLNLLLLGMALFVAVAPRLLVSNSEESAPASMPQETTRATTRAEARTSPPQGPPHEIRDEDIKSVSIRLERTPCYGNCPSYKLRIEGNGSVEYEGISSVEVLGIRTYEIPVERVRELVRQANKIGYFSLASSYHVPVTDLPSVTTAISDRTRLASVERNLVPDHVCEMVGKLQCAPASLHAFEQAIDEAAESTRFIGNPKDRRGRPL